MFLTGPEFLPELREHRGRTLTLIQDAQATGRTRMAEMNTHVLTNLDRRRGVRARDRTDRERLGQSPYITGAPWPPRAGTRRSLVRSRTSSSYAASFLRGGRVGATTFLGAKRQRGRLELSQLHRAGPRHEFVELLLGEEVGSAKAAGSAPRSNSPDFRTTRASTRNTRASGSWWPLLRGCGPRIVTVTLHVAMGVGGEGCFRGRLGMTTAVVYSCCAAVRTGREATSDFSWSFFVVFVVIGGFWGWVAWHASKAMRSKRSVGGLPLLSPGSWGEPDLAAPSRSPEALAEVADLEAVWRRPRPRRTTSSD